MKIKFMGLADVRRIEADDDGNGVLSDPIGADLVWSRENNWIINTEDDEYGDVDGSVWDWLVDSFPNEFKNVTDFKRIPLNENQKTYLAMQEGSQRTVAQEEAELEEQRRLRDEALAAEVEAANAQVEEEEKEAAKRAKGSGSTKKTKSSSGNTETPTTTGGSTA